MSNKFADHLKFGRKLRTPDKEASQKMVDHFNSQKDLFSQCPKCHKHLKGDMQQIMDHVCATSN